MTPITTNRSNGLCQGEEDVHGNAACEGEDILRCVASHRAFDSTIEVYWCEECRDAARVDGFTIHVASEV